MPMSSRTQLAILSFILRALLAVVFIVAAVGKLRSGMDPAATPTIYDLWIRNGSIWHYLFITGEFLLGAWLLSGLRPRLAAGAALVLLAIFSGLIAYETTKHAPRDCGCAGGGRVVEVTPEDVRKGLYLRLMANGVYMIAALWVTLVSPGRSHPPRGTSASPESGPALRHAGHEGSSQSAH